MGSIPSNTIYIKATNQTTQSKPQLIYNFASNKTLYSVYTFNSTFYVYRGGAWKLAVPYVYKNGKWNQAIGYTYKDKKWKL